MDALLFLRRLHAMAKDEHKFQAALIKDLKKIFPGCVVLKTNPGHIQGIPDLLLLYEKHWAALECKRKRTATRRPNQSYYIEKLNKMSFARFIYPENKEEVLNEVQQAFRL